MNFSTALILLVQIKFVLGKQNWSITCYGKSVNISCPENIVIHSAFLGLYSISSEYENTSCRNAFTQECVDDVTFYISNRCSGEKVCSIRLVKSIHLDVKHCKSVAKKSLPNLYIKYECVPKDLFISFNQAVSDQSEHYKVILLSSTGGYISSILYPFKQESVDLFIGRDIQLTYKFHSMPHNHQSKSVFVVFKLKDMNFISQGKGKTCEIGKMKTRDYLRINYNNQGEEFCTLDDRKVFPNSDVGPVALSNVSFVSNIDLEQKTVKQKDGRGILLQYILIYCNPIAVKNGSVSYDFQFTRMLGNDIEVTTFARITCLNGYFLWSKYGIFPNIYYTNVLDINCNSFNGEWAANNFSWPLNCLTLDEMEKSHSISSTTQLIKSVTSVSRLSAPLTGKYNVAETTVIPIQSTSNYSLILSPTDKDRILSSNIAGLLGGVMGLMFCIILLIGGYCIWKKRHKQKHKSLFPNSNSMNQQYMLNSMSPTISQPRRLTGDLDSYNCTIYSPNINSMNSILGTSSLTRSGFPRGAISHSSSFTDASILNSLPRDPQDPNTRTLPIKARKKSPLFWRSCSDNSRRDSKRLSKTFSITQLKGDATPNLPQSMNHDPPFKRFPTLSTYTTGTMSSRLANSPIRYSISTQRSTLYNEVPYSLDSVENYLEPVLAKGLPQNSSQTINPDQNRHEQYMLYNTRQHHGAIISPPTLNERIQSASGHQQHILPFASVPVERRVNNRSIDNIDSRMYKDRNSNAPNRSSFFGMQSNHYYGGERKSPIPSDTSIYESLDDENEENETSLVATAALSASLPLIPTQRQRIALPPAPVAMHEDYEDDMMLRKCWVDSSEENSEPDYESESGYQPVRVS